MYARIDFSTLGLMDALDLAMLIEVEARDRYLKFAAQLGKEGQGSPGSFFADMAENEAKHGREIAERRTELFGETPVQVSIDDLFDVEAPEVGAIKKTMSVVQAFDVGIAAEKKAYDFYQQALEHITDPEVIELFVELRDEEIEHVEMLEEAKKLLPASANEQGEIDYDETPYL